jgi:hypothetical protein
MACIGVIFALVTPRLVMIVLWIFSDYLSRAYDGIVVPLVGFFVLPTTTLAYAVAENETGGFRDWGAIVVIVAILLDLGLWGRGRGIFSRD